MKKVFCFVILFLALSLSGNAQQSEWEKYKAYGWVRQMAYDGDCLWLATNGGLVKYNVTTSERAFYTCSNSGLCSDNLISVDCRDGKVVVGSLYDGVSIFDGTTFENYDKRNAPFFSNQNFEEVVFDAEGRVWAGGLYYLYSFDGEGWEKYTLPSALQSSWVSFSALRFSSDGTLWFGCQGPSFDGSLGYFTKDEGLKATSLDVADIYRIDIDSQGRVWYCSSKGIACYDGIETKHFNSQNSLLPQGAIHGLCIDKDDNVWFGSGSKLAKYDGTSFEFFQVPTDKAVFDLLIVGDGIWVGTVGDGLFHFQDGNFEQVLSGTVLMANATTSVNLVTKDAKESFSNSTVYNLHGFPVTCMPRRPGVYVQDGRKVVAK